MPSRYKAVGSTALIARISTARPTPTSRHPVTQDKNRLRQEAVTALEGFSRPFGAHVVSTAEFCQQQRVGVGKAGVVGVWKSVSRQLRASCERLEAEFCSASAAPSTSANAFAPSVVTSPEKRTYVICSPERNSVHSLPSV